MRVMKASKICVTSRFHVAVQLFRNRLQMTSKCGKNKKVAHELLGECVTDVPTTFSCLLWSITEQMQGNVESFYHLKQQFLLLATLKIY